MKLPYQPLIILAAALILSGPFDVAAQPAAVVPPALPTSPISLGGMLQMLFGLVVVLAAVGGTAWLLRRFASGQVGMGGAAIRVIGGAAVGPKERLVLVEVGQTWLVVGVAPGQVNSIHTMPKPEGMESVSAGGPAENGFSVWLKQAVQRRHEA